MIKDGRKAVIRGRDFGQQLIGFIRRMKPSDVPDLLQRIDSWARSEKDKEARKRNPSEARMMTIDDRVSCIEAFCEDAENVEQVVNRMTEVFAGKECPTCRKHFNETVERCPACKTSSITDDKGRQWPAGPALVTPKGVLYSSVHRAKGLESRRVFILRTKEGPMPHPMAKSDWERGQELNIIYIAITRAREELVWVS
jgi:superfamily I DNA/RNA helicase